MFQVEIPEMILDSGPGAGRMTSGGSVSSHAPGAIGAVAWDSAVASRIEPGGPACDRIRSRSWVANCTSLSGVWVTLVWLSSRIALMRVLADAAARTTAPPAMKASMAAVVAMVVVRYSVHVQPASVAPSCICACARTAAFAFHLLFERARPVGVTPPGE